MSFIDSIMLKKGIKTFTYMCGGHLYEKAIKSFISQ